MSRLRRQPPRSVWAPTIDVYVTWAGSCCSIQPVTAWVRAWCATYCGAPGEDGRYVCNPHRAQVVLRTLYRAGATMHVSCLNPWGNISLTPQDRSQATCSPDLP